VKVYTHDVQGCHAGGVHGSYFSIAWLRVSAVQELGLWSFSVVVWSRILKFVVMQNKDQVCVVLGAPFGRGALCCGRFLLVFDFSFPARRPSVPRCAICRGFRRTFVNSSIQLEKCIISVLAP